MDGICGFTNSIQVPTKYPTSGLNDQKFPKPGLARFPVVPGVIGHRHVLPFVIGAGVLLGLQHRAIGDDHQHGVRDGELRSSVFSLGILKGMNLLWDAITLFVSGMHSALKCEQVDVM